MSHVHYAKGPDPYPKRPGFAVPKGAVDSHFHLFGPLDEYKLAADTPYLTGPALPESIIFMHDALGIDRGVIVSAGGYGRDYQHLLDTLERWPDRFRGVCVPPDDLSSAEMKRMDAKGVRGVRFVSDTSGTHVAKMLPEVAKRAADFGWHVQFIGARDGNIAAHADRLLALPNDIVIDHFGMVPVDGGVNQPGFQAVLRMLDTGRVWVKMSGPMHCSPRGYPFGDFKPLADALVKAAPDRLVWGTDWPHLHMMKRPMVNDGVLLDMLAEWVPDEAARNRILVDNPVKLYGF